MPLVILYKVAWLTWVSESGWCAFRFWHAKHPGGTGIAREFLQDAADPDRSPRKCSRF
jgi:hypothetical protein